MPHQTRSGKEKDGPEAPPSPLDIARHEASEHATLSTRFSGFAASTSHAVGSPFSFIAAIAIVIIWGVLGPMYHYSDTWQLVINTGTTIITFLMVFLIQNTQNRDAKAIHLKLNELIRALKPAHDELIDVEKLSDEELKHLDAYYQRVRAECERRNNPQKKTA
jgi:low affinity Fe/Cu permease